MDAGSYKIVTIGGIDIKVHWSWLLVLLLLTFGLAVGNFPAMMPGESTLFYWVLGFISSLLLFVSVLVHELSHSFVAKARGLNVHDITLFIFGGVSNIEQEPRTAGEEFWVAVVGPLTSFILAGIFFGLLQVVTPPVHTSGAAAATMLLYLAQANFLLGVFNMIPGFPLDGGRVLRAIIWGINHNFQSATRIAGFVGQLFAYGFILVGLWLTFYTGDLFSGLWIAFIGWFLLNAAQQSTAAVAMRETFRGITVSQLMDPPPPTAEPQITLAHLLTVYVLPYNARFVPVAENGHLTGVVSLKDIKDIPQDQWGMVTVGQVMTGQDKLKTVTPQDGLDKAMQLLSEGDLDQLPVVDSSGRLVGILSRVHVLRWLQIRNELKLRREAQSPQPPVPGS